MVDASPGTSATFPREDAEADCRADKYEDAGDANTEEERQEEEEEEEGDEITSEEEDALFEQFDRNPHELHRHYSVKEPLGEGVVGLSACYSDTLSSKEIVVSQI